ncbi:MAG: universal stress protein [Thermomicrobiales bacterium]
MLTLDGSELAEHSIPVAKTLARRLNIPINLVRALYMNYMVPPISEADDVLQELLAHDARLANEYLSTVSAKLMAEGIDVSITVEEGTPYEVVQSIAKPGDVVVLTSHGRSGIKRWLLGSVAEKLMRSSSVSVLLVPVTSGA